MNKFPARKILSVLMGLATIAISQTKDSSPSTWLGDARIGAFMHYLPGGPAEFSDVENFDTEALANQLGVMGAKYFIFTLGQNNGYFNAPNAAYDEITGYQPGERCSNRDLPADLAKSLGSRGIRLMLYLPCQVPNRDARAQKAFGLPEGEKDQPIDPTFAKKWAKVINEWSIRYGEKVSGWWFDGGFDSVEFNEQIAEIYTNSAKVGNPRSMVSFNPGIGIRRHTRSENYAAGELNEPFDVVPAASLIDGVQWHALTFLGSTWGRRDTRKPTEPWCEWFDKVTTAGGAVTLDVGPNMDRKDGAIGAIAEAQVEQFRTIALSRKPITSNVTLREKAKMPDFGKPTECEVRLFCDDEGELFVNGVSLLKATDYQRIFETRVTLKRGDIITATVKDLQGGPGGSWAILVFKDDIIAASAKDFVYSTAVDPLWQTDPSLKGYRKPKVSDLSGLSLGNLKKPQKAWSQPSDNRIGTLHFKYVVP